MTTSYPKRRTVAGHEYLLHGDGRVFLHPDTWHSYATESLDAATLLCFHLHRAATIAHGGNPVEVVGLYFEAPTHAPRWRVEVTGGLESSTGVSEWLTAVLFRDSVEVEASVPMPAPARGRGFYGAVLEQAYGVAAQLLQEAHRFLLGADLTESAGAP